MTIYVIFMGEKVGRMAFTSLKGACAHAGVSYDSAVRGKRVWAGSEVIRIEELDLKRVTGRGKR